MTWFTQNRTAQDAAVSVAGIVLFASAFFLQRVAQPQFDWLFRLPIPRFMLEPFASWLFWGGWLATIASFIHGSMIDLRHYWRWHCLLVLSVSSLVGSFISRVDFASPVSLDRIVEGVVTYLVIFEVAAIVPAAAVFVFRARTPGRRS